MGQIYMNLEEYSFSLFSRFQRADLLNKSTSHKSYKRNEREGEKERVKAMIVHAGKIRQGMRSMMIKYIWLLYSLSTHRLYRDQDRNSVCYVYPDPAVQQHEMVNQRYVFLRIRY